MGSARAAAALEWDSNNPHTGRRGYHVVSVALRGIIMGIMLFAPLAISGCLLTLIV